MLGLVYAQAKVSDDPTLQKAVYWASVDQFAKAKSVEPTEDMVEVAIKSVEAVFDWREYLLTVGQYFDAMRL